MNYWGYSITIRPSAYKNLWADCKGNIYKMTKHGGMFLAKTYINNAGYEICSVINNGKSTTVTVQRIVATAWLPNPQHLSDVDHIDDDKLNNSIDNLQWLSHRDNLARRHNFSRQHQVLKLVEGKVIKTYSSISSAARDNDLSFSSVRGSANHQLALDRYYYFEFEQEAR